MELREGLPGPALTLPPAQRRGRTAHPAVLFAPGRPVRLGPPRAQPTKGRDDHRLGLLEPRFTPDAAHGERSLGQRQCPQLVAAGVKNAEGQGSAGRGCREPPGPLWAFVYDLTLLQSTY